MIHTVTKQAEVPEAFCGIWTTLALRNDFLYDTTLI